MHAWISHIKLQSGEWYLNSSVLKGYCIQSRGFFFGLVFFVSYFVYVYTHIYVSVCVCNFIKWGISRISGLLWVLLASQRLTEKCFLPDEFLKDMNDQRQTLFCYTEENLKNKKIIALNELTLDLVWCNQKHSLTLTVTLFFISASPSLKLWSQILSGCHPAKLPEQSQGCLLARPGLVQQLHE